VTPSAAIGNGGDDDAAGGRVGTSNPVKRFLFGALVLAGICLFVALGIWQLQRLVWKLDLIRTVDERIHAEPAASPGPASWRSFNPEDEAYRRVVATGHFVGERATLVQAVTKLGSGFWVLEPFHTDAGFTILVNRGFATGEETKTLPLAHQTETRVTGLLRATEPDGAFLRQNDPASARWYSRDVSAIAAAQGLGDVAPYFIDADAAPGGIGVPAGGLTVVNFRNSHLIYALTWLGLAAMLTGWTVHHLVREQRKRRANGSPFHAAPQ
jgi:surfeit locus 1 family protein